MSCRGVWILHPSGDIIAAGVQADGQILERLAQEAREAFLNGKAYAEFSPGGHQWIRLYPMRSNSFQGIVAVWDDNRGEDELRLEITSMAHDINNVLAVAAGHLELLQAQSEDPGPASLGEALWMLDRAVDLVKRLGRIGTQDEQPRVGVATPVREPLEHLCAWLSPSRYRIELECDESTPTVRLDRADFIEIFQNLLKNACEAMPDGGVIAIQVRAYQDHVSIIVRDRGPGIRSEQIDAIFAPHFTTKHHGQGLGLYRTRQLVEACGGRIQVVSTPGLGSSFMVTLPSLPDSDIMKDSRTIG
ncbi:MAG: HAMP domain-containing histidine kinase [Firmicutes bacterium]|nr:HAMP domain-containing histidine kinase [Bacillota bacterium]